MSSTTRTSDEAGMPGRKPYVEEAVDRLPFGSPEKSRRYATERYHGAVGRNWYTCDPSLQFMVRYHLAPEEIAWAEPHLERLGELIGDSVAERAEHTDRHPPELVKYDRWGHDISDVLVPESCESAKRDLLSNNFSNPAIRREGEARGFNLRIPGIAYSYMLCQADIGVSCALGTGGSMVEHFVDHLSPPDVRDRLMPRIEAGEFRGETAQSLTERTGGSDLGQLETTATPAGDGTYRLNGFKWFVSNADGNAYVVLAKVPGASDDIRGVENFLVLRERRDGSRNGIRIRRLKDKLGTKSVVSAEVEFVDAEAWLLSGGGNGTGDGRGLSRMMELTNGARLGVALMGLGCARRALVESICYARARDAWGSALIEKPLVRRKLAEMIVEVEAAQALVFDGYGEVNALRREREARMLRLAAPVAKLRAARLGVTMASDAIEMHGGNGYVEDWPVARILRDAQVNTIWEGPDNILCLDVRRAIERNRGDEELLRRLYEAVHNAGEGDGTPRLVRERVEDLERAIAAWKELDRETAEARTFPLAQYMADVYAAALLVEQAEWERRAGGGERKALVARLYARAHLETPGPLRGMEAPQDEALTHFDELVAGVLVEG